MPLHAQRGLALVGFGLLVGFVGLVLVANLFGVADEFAERIAKNRRNQLFGVPKDPEKGSGAYKLGRLTAGFGFVAVGLLAVGGGVVHLVAPPSG
jgi:hypothetical protein